MSYSLGGFGTLDELFEAITLMQTQKIPHFPVVLFGSSYWQGLLDWLKQFLVAEGQIDAIDLDLMRITDSPAAACDWLVEAYCR